MRKQNFLATLEIVQDQEQAAYISTPPTPTKTDGPSKPSPDAPAWGSGIALGYWILSVLLIVIIPAMILVPYAMMQDPPITDNKALVEFAKNDKNAIVLQVLAIVPAHLLTLLLGWLIVTRGRKDSFKEALGWQSGGIRWWHYPLILISFFAVAGAVSSFFPEQDNDLIRMIQSSQAALISVALLATVTAPIVEELVYRGVMFSAFQKTLGVPAAFVLVTLLFALVHVPQYWPSFSTIILLTLLSFILTGLRIYSKNLWPCIVLHTIFNGLQSVGLILSSYYEKKDPAAEAAFIATILK